MKHNTTFLCIGLFIFFVLSTGMSVYGNGNVCTARLSDCIESYNKQTLTVPKNVDALISQFNICNRVLTVDKKLDGTGPLVPSIMVLIDNSNSMNGVDNGDSPCDTAGRRFEMVSKIIDSIYLKFPTAEVGISVFVEYLFYDTNDQYVIPLPYDIFPSGQPKSQGYLPMRRLDSLVSNGVRWVDVLKQHLETKDTLVKNSAYSSLLRTTLLKSKPSFKYSGLTNCNVAFETARIEFAKTSNIKDNHFVIFISDGEPNREWPNNSSNYFVQGIKIPSTLTIYMPLPDFDSARPSIISTFTSMTQNIKNNAYSISNNRSQCILMQSSVDSMVDKVDGFISPHAASRQIVLNVEPVVKVNGELCSGDYSNGIYKLTNDFILPDSLNYFTIQKEFKTSILGFPEIRDTVMTTNFFIEKRDNAAVSSGVSIDCNTGNSKQRADDVDLRNTVSYSCGGNVLSFRGKNLLEIDIVSLNGKMIAQISGNGKDFVSIDTRSISGIKTGFYCAKVKSLNGLSTVMISIGVDIK
jgi:hypothetical protein